MGRAVRRSAVLLLGGKGWQRRSLAGIFHAILATSSIAEAISHYRAFRDEHPKSRVTALFNPSISNNAGAVYKEEDPVVRHINI